ncbi:hypothetical protein Leryth_022247 [Lithospermum erythrorhizon]|nr:hypothetical protein Leryth_022247 [Lithospermum erythrorhizon]
MRSQSMSSSSSIWPEIESQPSISQFPSDAKNNSDCNIYQLLAKREVCPRTKHSFKKIWGKGSTSGSDRIRCKASTDARRGLISWVEAESMRHLSAKYCPLSPPPRSTIAAAFSPDGLTLASTHGDHTVKLIDWQTGRCLKVLSGHRRTPWVVRFHPLHPEVLASGSLDHPRHTCSCRSISLLNNLIPRDILAVASGHKLVWYYNREAKPSSQPSFWKTHALSSGYSVHLSPEMLPSFFPSNSGETPTVPASNVTNLRTAGRSGSRRRSSRNVGADLVDSQPFTNKCRLIIPHAVLCSEMGAHFSPCGRFLAACVACVLPNMESDPGSHCVPHPDVAGAGTSPTRHPISAHQIMYELRIYSLEEATFGSVLASRAIRAAHCLTSIQFSPTSEHLLLAYGRRHNSLLKNVVIDGEATVAIYTILEVYRVSDMELVKVLPSAEDEVNVACFHPSVGNGLVYGTKEGKLRIFQSDASQVIDHTGTSFPVDHMLEVPTYALEG